MDNHRPQLNKKLLKLVLLAAVLAMVIFGLKLGLMEKTLAATTDNIFSNVMTDTFGKTLGAPEKFDHTLAGADYQSVFNRLVKPGIFLIADILESAKNKLLSIFAQPKATPIIIEVSRTPKVQAATSTTVIITQIVNSDRVKEIISREVREIVKREVQTVNTVKTIETKEIIYKDAPVVQAPSTPITSPNQFLQNNFMLTGEPGQYLTGDTRFGGTISFDKGTVIDWTGVNVFNWPINAAAGGAYSGGGQTTGSGSTANYLTAETDPILNVWFAYTHSRFAMLNASTTNIDALTVYGDANFHSLTTTDTLLVGGYASTTGGLFTQGAGHFGGDLTIDANATTSGSGYFGTLGLNNEYINSWSDISALAGNFTLTDWFATTTWAGGHDLTVNGNATTTGTLMVGTDQMTDWGVPTSTLMVNGSAIFTGSATTSGILEVLEYATSTGGFFTQGDIYAGGNATTTGSFNLGNDSEFIRYELEPHAANPALGNIPWLKGRSLDALGGINVFGINTGLLIRETGDTTYPEPAIIFLTDTDLEASRIYANTPDDTMMFSNAAGGYIFDDTVSIGGAAAANIGLDVSMAVTSPGSDSAVYGISLTSNITPANGYNAYGMHLNPALIMSVGNTYPLLANLYVDGYATAAVGGTATDYYGLYVDAPSLGGSAAADNLIGAYIGGNVGINVLRPTVALDVFGTASTTGLVVNGSATTTGNLMLGVGDFTKWGAPSSTLMVNGSAIFTGSATTSGILEVMEYATTTGGLFTQGDIYAGGNATSSYSFFVGSQFNLGTTSPWADYEMAIAGDGVFDGNLLVTGSGQFNNVSTTDTLYVGGYASTTGGLFTQGDIYAGANATTSGSTYLGLTAGLNDVYINNWTDIATLTGSDIFTLTNWFATTTWAGGHDLTVNGNATTTGTLMVGTDQVTDWGVPTSTLMVNGSAIFTGSATTSGYLWLATTTNSEIGVIYLGDDRFIHRYGVEGNTFVGRNAGNFTLTAANAKYNTGLGEEALDALTTGASNDAFGYKTLTSNNTGSNNSAFGLYALYANSAGAQNTAFGGAALYVNTSATSSSAFGFNSLYANTGAANTALGTYAGYNFPNTAFRNTTGVRNVFIGWNASPESGTLENAIAIGASSTIAISNAMALGGIDTEAVNVGITTSTPAYKLTINADVATTGLLQVATTTNQNIFTIGANGRVGIGTSTPSATLAITDTDSPDNSIYVDSGAKLTIGGAWEDVSSAESKENFVVLDNNDILSKIMSLPLKEYNYIKEPDATKHFGAMAEDWYTAFGLGGSSTISGKDTAMISLAGLQALSAKFNALPTTTPAQIYSDSLDTGTVYVSGQVGIGTTTPWAGAALAVNGDIAFDGAKTTGTLFIGGLATSTFAGNLEVLGSLAGDNQVLNIAGDAVISGQLMAAKLTLNNLETGNNAAVYIDANGRLTKSVSAQKYLNNIDYAGVNGDLVYQLPPVAYTELNTGQAQLGFVAEDIALIEPRLVIYDKDGQPESLRYDQLTALLTKAIQDLHQQVNPLVGGIDVDTGFAGNPFLAVDALGNIGLGTTLPNYKLQVAGDIAATGFINVSARDAKKDIKYLENTDYESILAKLQATNVATYHYNSECNAAGGPCEDRLGLIAEEAPTEVLSADGRGVDLYKLASFILGGLKAQQKQIGQLMVQTAATTTEPLAVIDAPDLNVKTLAVQSAAAFYGAIYVKGEAGFESKVVFNQDIEVKGKIYTSPDQAGTAIIPANGTSTEIIFNQEYQVVPKVVTSLSGDDGDETTFINWKIIRKTNKGFTILLQTPVDKNLIFDWIALGVKSENGPIITELISADSVSLNSAIELWAKVSDPDTQEQDLRYTWDFSPNIGQLSGGAGQVSWNVPDGAITADTDVTVTVTVSDGNSATSTSKIIKVLANEPAAELVATEPLASPKSDPERSEGEDAGGPAEPVVTEPDTEPVVTEPATEPVVTEPATEPIVTEPPTEPVVTEPAAEPVVVESPAEPPA